MLTNSIGNVFANQRSKATPKEKQYQSLKLSHQNPGKIPNPFLKPKYAKFSVLLGNEREIIKLQK